jgi:hypothetical protein
MPELDTETKSTLGYMLLAGLETTRDTLRDFQRSIEEMKEEIRALRGDVSDIKAVIQGSTAEAEHK